MLTDVWFLGDAFLKEIFGSFLATKSKAKSSLPNLFEYYNVFPLYQNPVNSTRSRLTCIINALVEKMNEEEKLPRYIIIILDKDITEEAFFYDFGVKFILKDLLGWIQCNIDCCIETRKEDIRGKRAGALTSAVEPRYVWVAPLHRPPNSARKNIYSLVNKCKETLEYIVSHEGHCHYLELTSVNEYAHFDHWGNLTLVGKDQLWKELDQQMRCFDRSDLDLLPKEEGVNRKSKSSEKSTDIKDNSRSEKRHDARQSDHRRNHEAEVRHNEQQGHSRSSHSHLSAGVHCRHTNVLHTYHGKY